MLRETAVAARRTFGVALETGAAGLALLEDDRLGAFPQDDAAQLGQLLAALLDRGEVVARQLAHIAGEAGRPVREEDLDLREAAGVEEDLTGRRVAVGVLRAEVELELPAHRHP